MNELEARTALNEMPISTLEDMLTLSEAHAALHHIFCETAHAPQEDEPGWAELRRLLSMANEAGCSDESHFTPLFNLDTFRASLLAQQQDGVISLVRLLGWESAQAPLHLRTRGKTE